jgi:uridine kinase
VDAFDLIMKALNTTSPVVTDSYYEGGQKKTRKNEAKTKEAQTAQGNLKMLFRNHAAKLSEGNRGNGQWK